MAYTADQIVKKYIELRDYVAARTKEFNETGATAGDAALIDTLRNANMVEIVNVAPMIADRLEQLLTPMKTYKEGMELLEGLAAAQLKETKQTALNTEYGTAFPVRKNRTTVAEPEKFQTWVRETQAWHFLTNHVSTEAVDDWMEKNEGVPPPGVSVEGYTRIQFRKV